MKYNPNFEAYLVFVDARLVLSGAVVYANDYCFQ